MAEMNSPITGPPINTCWEVVVYTPKTDSLQSHVATGVDSVYRQAENQYLRTYQALHFGGEETAESRVIRSIATSSPAPACPTHTDKEMAKRLSDYRKVAPTLENLSEEELAALLANATPLGKGCAATAFLAKAEGVELFIKKIPLTALEQRNPISTRNLFGLPAYYQYNVGSLGFGARREIEANKIATHWVLNGDCQNFPLMYHYRVVKRTTQPPPLNEAELEDRRYHVAYWNSQNAVGEREKAVDEASADVVVFMEKFPETLHAHIGEMAKSNALSERVLAKLELELTLVTNFMKSHGFVHFDTHFGNILTSGDHVYFADFGLAVSRRFDLSPEERAFFEEHINYDSYQVIKELVDHVIRPIPADKEGRAAWNSYLSTGRTNVSPAVDSLAERYRPIVLLFAKHIKNIVHDYSKRAQLPEPELTHHWTKLQSQGRGSVV